MTQWHNATIRVDFLASVRFKTICIVFSMLTLHFAERYICCVLLLSYPTVHPLVALFSFHCGRLMFTQCLLFSASTVADWCLLRVCCGRLMSTLCLLFSASTVADWCLLRVCSFQLPLWQTDVYSVFAVADSCLLRVCSFQLPLWQTDVYSVFN